MDNSYTMYLNEVLQSLGPLERCNTVVCPPGKGNYTSVGINLQCDTSERIIDAMQETIMVHKGGVGGVFRSYNIQAIDRIGNQSLLDRYNSYKQNVYPPHEKILFHGTNNVDDILRFGFDKSETNPSGMFGGGFYFADISSKANQYVFGEDGCPKHGDTSCYRCSRKMLLCRVTIGNSKQHVQSHRYDTAPQGYHSVTGVPSPGGLKYKEYVVYKEQQIYPEIVVTYQIQR